MPAFGIRAILFAAAVVLFFIGLVADVADSFDTWVPLGLIALAAAFLVDALGLDRQLGGPSGP